MHILSSDLVNKSIKFLVEHMLIVGVCKWRFLCSVLSDCIWCPPSGMDPHNILKSLKKDSKHTHKKMESVPTSLFSLVDSVC